MKTLKIICKSLFMGILVGGFFVVFFWLAGLELSDIFSRNPASSILLGGCLIYSFLAFCVYSDI